MANNDEIQDLINLLGLEHVEFENVKGRIIRILFYLNRITDDIFDILPEEIFIRIMQMADCDTILLMCQISNKFSLICRSGKLDGILKWKIGDVPYNLDGYNINQLTIICKRQEKDISLQGQILSMGLTHTLIIKNNNVYSMGMNKYGQLGQRGQLHVYTPTLIPYIDDVISVSAGLHHSLILTKDGQVYSLGSNISGQLGLGDTVNRYVPTLIPNLKDIIAISADRHSLVLTKDGEVYSFGYNNLGQLGLGDTTDRYVPTLIPELFNIIGISAGGGHSLILTKEGHVYSFGDNYMGQLGLSNDDNDDDDSDDSDIYNNIINRLSPTMIPNLNNIISISTGDNSSLVLTNNGQVYIFGHNLSGPPIYTPKLINGLSEVISISTGSNHSIILTSNGKIYSLGNNTAGQLGLGDTKDRYLHTEITVPKLNDFIEITAGYNSTGVVTKYGNIYLSGSNRFGQLGLGNERKNILTPIPDFKL